MPGEAPPTPARAHQPLFSCISTTAARECACEDLVGKKRLLIYKKNMVDGRMAGDVVCAQHNVYRGSHVLSAAAVLEADLKTHKQKNSSWLERWGLRVHIYPLRGSLK